MDYAKIPVSGSCDVCKIVPATTWWGNTSAATCRSQKCLEKMQERWDEHCRMCDEESEDSH